MGTEEKGEVLQQTTGPQDAAGLRGAVEAKYRQIKEHAETYPYVWASYIVTEDRVRALQERLRKHYAAEEACASSSTPAVKVPASADKISN
ncbi:hypothetical protein D8674_004695 [Pyrus ussuriensis x Pyrus communis]|uniref:Uncharacterized protein n=1 Tax=Pyrus ussuriensis x Pyrus communis TaxID=2448454 RepID=A0A5N5FQP2_9ROSA|nr:hypothetical protein D8674_004695 [Pyrus ussuriensis x Pyrus communis]